MVSSWKKKWNGNKQKPKCVTEIDWSSKWIPYWNTPEVKEKSEKMSNNRLTDVGGGCSKHSGGSKSSVAHMETLKRKSSDKEPTLFDLHKETHMRKNGTFVDDRAKRICEDYENRLIEESTTRTLTTAEQNEIYKEIAGVKKQRVYGIGSMSGSYGSDGRTSASCLLENGTKEAEFNQLKNELADEKAKVAKLEETVDREKKNREKIEEKLDCEKKNREKIEEKLERLIERVNDTLGGPSN